MNLDPAAVFAAPGTGFHERGGAPSIDAGGSVDPGTLGATFAFEFGPTEAYGSSTVPVTLAPGAAQAVAAAPPASTRRGPTTTGCAPRRGNDERRRALRRGAHPDGEAAGPLQGAEARRA